MKAWKFLAPIGTSFMLAGFLLAGRLRLPIAPPLPATPAPTATLQADIAPTNSADQSADNPHDDGSQDDENLDNLPPITLSN